MRRTATAMFCCMCFFVREHGRWQILDWYLQGYTMDLNGDGVADFDDLVFALTECGE